MSSWECVCFVINKHGKLKYRFFVHSTLSRSEGRCHGNPFVISKEYFFCSASSSTQTLASQAALIQQLLFPGESSCGVWLTTCCCPNLDVWTTTPASPLLSRRPPPKTRNFGAPAILLSVWVVLWRPTGYQNRWFAKWQVLGIFKTRNFGVILFGTSSCPLRQNLVF